MASDEEPTVEMCNYGAGARMYGFGDEDAEVDGLVVDGFVGCGCYVEGGEFWGIHF